MCTVGNIVFLANKYVMKGSANFVLNKVQDFTMANFYYNKSLHSLLLQCFIHVIKVKFWLGSTNYAPLNDIHADVTVQSYMKRLGLY